MSKREIIDLEALKPKPHPFRAVLRRHKISNAMVANYLGLSLPYIGLILGGQNNMPAHQEAKLQILVDQLESGAQ